MHGLESAHDKTCHIFAVLWQSHGQIDGLMQGRCNSIESIANALGAVSVRKTVLPGMVIPMLKIKRPNGRLIFNMEIAIRR